MVEIQLTEIENQLYKSKSYRSIESKKSTMEKTERSGSNYLDSFFLLHGERRTGEKRRSREMDFM